MISPITRSLLLVPALVLSVTASASALKTEKQRFSYTVGVQMAMGMKSQGVDVDVDALTAAIRDVFANHEPALSSDEMRQVLMSYQQREAEARSAKAEDNRRRGSDFLASNRKKDGVKVLDSGLQYRVLKAGKGPRPSASDTVVVNYRGTLTTGEEFDSSYSRGEPATFPVGGVIQGWQQILPMMPVGSKWQIVVPSDLAYGAAGAGGRIGPNETLVFDIELLEIKGK